MSKPKDLIQGKWTEAVDKSNAKNKDLLKKIDFVDTNDEEYDDNWMINFRVSNKVYHLEYDRKGKPMYSCYDLEKETGINVLELGQIIDSCYEGDLRAEVYESIYTLSPKQKLELLKCFNGIDGFIVKSHRYLNGNLELVLRHPVIEREITINVPLVNVTISLYDNHSDKQM